MREQLSAIDEIQARLKHLGVLDYAAIIGVLIGLAIAVYTYALRHT